MGFGTLNVGAGRICPVSPRTSILRFAAGSTITGASTVQSCIPLQNASTGPHHLVRWAMYKFKRLRHRPDRAWAWLDGVRRREPTLFAHWHLIAHTSGRAVGAG